MYKRFIILAICSDCDWKKCFERLKKLVIIAVISKSIDFGGRGIINLYKKDSYNRRKYIHFTGKRWMVFESLIS